KTVGFVGQRKLERPSLCRLRRGKRQPPNDADILRALAARIPEETEFDGSGHALTAPARHSVHHVTRTEVPAVVAQEDFHLRHAPASFAAGWTRISNSSFRSGQRGILPCTRTVQTMRLFSLLNDGTLPAGSVTRVWPAIISPSVVGLTNSTVKNVLRSVSVR